MLHMNDKPKKKEKHKKKIRIVPVKESRYVKTVLLLPKEVVTELIHHLNTPLSQ